MQRCDAEEVLLEPTRLPRDVDRGHLHVRINIGVRDGHGHRTGDCRPGIGAVVVVMVMARRQRMFMTISCLEALHCLDSVDRSGSG